MAKFDTRLVSKKCQICKKDDLENIMELENHMEYEHEGEIVMNDGTNDLNKLMAEMTKAVMSMAKNSPDRKSTTQLTKAKVPPLWIDRNFERF